VFAPAISGSGEVVVEAGTTVLTANSSFSGTTAVVGGNLTVNGSIASSTTNVNGGVLSGTGTVGNVNVTSGTFAPGSGTPGTTMNINGNLALQSGALYLVQVNPQTASSATVSGTATLGGASVNAVFASGSYVNKQYTIVTAGTVNGTFGTLVSSNLPTNLVPSLSYDSTHAFLNVALSFGGGGASVSGGGGFSANQQNVVNAITSAFNSGASLPIALATLTPAGLSNAAGELGTGAIQSSIRASDLFLNTLLDPTLAGRVAGFTTPGSASRFTDAAAVAGLTARERDAYAMAAKAPSPLTPQTVGRWNVWAAGYGGSATIAGDAAGGSHDTTTRIGGGAVGADYRVSPDTLFGFALGGGGTSYTVASGLGAASADLFQAGVYGRHEAGPAYAAAAFAYGWQDITSRRTVASDILQGRFGVDSFSGRFEGGYRIATPFSAVTPYAAVQAIRVDLPAYTEQSSTGSAFVLRYAAKDVTDTRTELGARADESFAMADSVITLRSRLAWAHDYNPDRTVSAVFQALPGASFVVNGARPGANSTLVSAGAEQKWLNGFALAATFEGEFARNVASYAGKGILKYSW
jgi:uncharacterized protein with beta-barrel porin domain